MPVLLGILTIAMDVLFIVHVVRSGRDKFWVWIILGFPVLGSFIYIAAEMLPEYFRGPAGQKARTSAVTALDPERAYREARQQFEIADSIDNRRAVAREAIALRRSQEALDLLLAARTGMYADDPALLTAIAEAHFAAGQPQRTVTVLDELRAAHPEFRSADAHLLYARAQEAAGNMPAALAEYEAVAGYYPGEEARCRLAAALEAGGNRVAAQAIYAEVCRSVERSPAYYRRAQKQWYEVAKRSLGP